MMSRTPLTGIAATPPSLKANRNRLARTLAGALRRLIASVLLITSLTPGASMAAPYEEDMLEFYLMNLAADGYSLAESVSTYRRDGTDFIHFESFLKAVEFPIHREGSVWTGWFRSEQSRFTWSADPAEAPPDADLPPSTRPDFFESDEGMFVSLDALEVWFDLELTPIPRTQTIAITSADPLPFQKRDARASAKYRYRPGAADAVATHVPDQYRWATVPLVDLSSHYSIQDGGGERRRDAQASLTMGLDLMKHSMLYSGSTVSQSGQRLRIERRAPIAGGTLALGIDSYALGDIVDDKSNLVNGGGRGAGFSINRRAESGGSQSRVTISGDGPPGWETELYRNNALVTFGSVASDGLYAFPEQETVYGENVFIVRLFGPQGQIREQRQSFWGGGIDLAQGDYSFSVSHVDFTERFIGGDLESTSSSPSEDTTRFHYARALTSNLQLGAGYTRASVGSRAADGTFSDSEYGTVDGRMNVRSGLLLAELVRQQERGSAWSLQYLTGVAGHNIAVSRQEFRDFESPYTVRRVEADAQSQLTLSGPLDLPGLRSYTVRLTQHDRADGLSDFRLFNRLGGRWGPANVSNDLDFLRVSSGDEFLLGKLRVTGRWNRLSLRGQIDYDPADAEPLNQVSAMLRWNGSGGASYTVTAHKDLKNGRVLYLDTTMTTVVGNLDLSLSLNTSSDDFWAIGIGLGTRFGYGGGAGSFGEYGGSLAHTGRATLNLFMDRNNNGVREVDEPPLNRASYKDHRTSEMAAGAIKLARIPAHTPLRIDSRDFRFEDPFLLARDDAYELYTHPGGDVSADIPVLMTGDAEGHLHPVPGTDSTVSGVSIVLYDADGEPVAETRSEFDGYYSFSGIAAGDYQVVIDASPRQAEVHRQWFSLNAEEGFAPLSPIFIYWN
ncbi:MAG: SdrD B-like domain-containing protein [Woeseia sp.]